MESWEERLAAAEEGVRERERAVSSGESTPEELPALAEERDEIATDWDAPAEAADEQARA